MYVTFGHIEYYIRVYLVYFQFIKHNLSMFVWLPCRIEYLFCLHPIAFWSIRESIASFIGCKYEM